MTLLPGVAQALALSAPLMRLAVKEVWTREVIHINKMNTDEEQLRNPWNADYLSTSWGEPPKLPQMLRHSGTPASALGGMVPRQSGVSRHFRN